MLVAGPKNHIIKGIMAVLLFCLCIGMVQPLPAAGVEAAEDGGAGLVLGKKITGETSRVAASNALSLWVNGKNGFFEIRKSGKTTFTSNSFNEEKSKGTTAAWRNVQRSQIVVYYSTPNGKSRDNMNSYTYSVRKHGLSVYEIENGFAAEYRFPDIQITVWLYVQLNNGALDVTVPYDKIKANSSGSILTDIEILPFFGAVESQKKGFMLVPDGSGGIIGLDHAPTSNSYSVQVFGEDESLKTKKISELSQQAVMPVYGLSSSTGSFFTVITQGEATASINAYTAGNKTPYNNIYTRFKLRSIDEFSTTDWSGQSRVTPILESKELNYKAFSQRYYLLNPNTDYNEMAAIYRKHMQDIGQLGTKIMSDNTSAALELFGAVEKSEPVLGIPVKVTKKLTSYKQAAKITEFFQSGGVNDILIVYKNATKASVRNKALSGGEYYGKLGSKSDLNKLKALVGEDQLFIENNPFSVRKMNFAFWSIGNTVTKLTGSPVYRYRYDLASGVADESTRLMLYNTTTASRLLHKYIDNLNNSSVKTIFIDGIGRSIYSDFGKNYTNRSETVESYQDILEQTGDMVAMVDTGNAYAWKNADWIAGLSMQTGGNVLIDREIPFAQTVLCGITGYTSQPVNLTSNVQTSFLKAAETHSTLTFSFIYKSVENIKDTELSDRFAVGFSLWKEKALEMMKRQNELFSATKSSGISRHEYLSETLVKVVYSNGVSVYINYSEDEQKAEQIAVPGMDFVIVR